MSGGLLIGLTGAPSAGKDSAAAILCAAQWRSVAFADALRVEVSEAFAIDQRLLTDRRHKESPTPQLSAGMASNANWLRWAAVNGHSLIQPRSPRWVMQSWGSFRRQTEPDYWVRHVTYWAKFQRQYQPRNLVITDVRYPNEAQALRDLGGHIVRVYRPGTAPVLAPDTAGHDSEHHGAIQAAADIHNDGPLEALGAEVWRVVRQLQDQP